MDFAPGFDHFPDTQPVRLHPPALGTHLVRQRLDRQTIRITPIVPVRSIRSPAVSPRPRHDQSPDRTSQLPDQPRYSKIAWSNREGTQ